MTEQTFTHFRALVPIVVAGKPYKAGEEFQARPTSIGLAAVATGLVEPIEVESKGKKKGEETLPP